MAGAGVKVFDLHLLEVFFDKIGESSNAMEGIDASVVSYIHSVRDSLESQLDMIQQRLREAEANLNSAENALTACYALQVCNEFGELCPSCSMEESNVETARCEVDKWRMRYEQGQRILGECQQEISDYIAGGHELVRTMCERQSPKAQQLLGVCIEKLYGILSSNVEYVSPLTPPTL